MLTKNDLQQIRIIVGEEIQNKTPIIVKRELKPVKQKLDKLHKDFHSFVDHFDGRLTKVEKNAKALSNN